MGFLDFVRRVPRSRTGQHSIRFASAFRVSTAMLGSSATHCMGFGVGIGVPKISELGGQRLCL